MDTDIHNKNDCLFCSSVVDMCGLDSSHLSIVQFQAIICRPHTFVTLEVDCRSSLDGGYILVLQQFDKGNLLSVQ